MSPSALPPLLSRHCSCPRAEERKNGSTFLGVPRSHSPLLCSSMPSRRPTLLAGGPSKQWACLFWRSRMSAHDQYWAIILPGTLLVGLGVAFQIVTVAIAATDGVADDEQGLASGLFNTSQQVGSALGVAILVAVASARTVALSTGSGGPGGSAALVGGFQSALLTAVGFAILSVVVSLLVVREVRLTGKQE